MKMHIPIPENHRIHFREVKTPFLFEFQIKEFSFNPEFQPQIWFLLIKR